MGLGADEGGGLVGDWPVIGGWCGDVDEAFRSLSSATVGACGFVVGGVTA